MSGFIWVKDYFWAIASSIAQQYMCDTHAISFIFA